MARPCYGGIAGSCVVAAWAYGLVRDTGAILLGRTPETSDLADEIRRAVEKDGESRIDDLHIWQVAAGRYAAIVCVVAREPQSCSAYRDVLREHEELVHVTVEARRILNGEMMSIASNIAAWLVEVAGQSPFPAGEGKALFTGFFTVPEAVRRTI